MKTRAMLAAAVIALAVMASARVASAQNHLVVTIPFDFAAGNASLPAGDYAVRTSESSRTLLLISTTDPEASVIIPANAAQAADVQTQSKLVFNRYGDRYFLSQVWMEGSALGKQLMKSAREKEVATVAKAETQGRVTLVASLH